MNPVIPLPRWEASNYNCILRPTLRYYPGIKAGATLQQVQKPTAKMYVILHCPSQNFWAEKQHMSGMRSPQVQAERQLENSAPASQRFLTLVSIGGPVFGDILSHHAIFQHFELMGRFPSITQLRAS